MPADSRGSAIVTSGPQVVDLIASLRSFIRVAETKSFSAVAAERGVTQPAISRQISALEVHLGTRVVHRSTQAVTLTDEGRHFLIAARELVAAADAMRDSAAHRRGKPVGLVRLAVQECLGLRLVDHIPTLLREHEELSVELVVRNRTGNLVEEGLDLEVLFGPIEDSTVVTRTLGTVSAPVVASPEYLARRGTPEHPGDLEGHECIVLGDGRPADAWWFIKSDDGHDANELAFPATVNGRFRSNHLSSIHRAVLAGQGIASLPLFLVLSDLRSGALEQLLPQFRRPGWPVHVTYPNRLALPRRTRVVIDFLVALFLEESRTGNLRDNRRFAGLAKTG
jgi:DNA-binding transcriptional LysR family regulator